uniref:Swi1p n=1 Tax=Ganoderma boninense TaxID=34458 RepID=A0A5K1K252_9APHY|nr:Swi1p [Ganoderma boninense]
MHTSPMIGEFGAHSLNQDRLRIADDMAHQSVLLTLKDFCDHLLPDPSNPRFSKASRPNVRKNPFAALTDAKNMSEFDISIILVIPFSFTKEEDVSSGKPQWTDQGVPIEFKYGLDPFDEKKSGNADATSREKVRGQVTHYAELIMSIQQRLFLFMFVIIGRKFCILRWDRSGVVVSEAVDYVDGWEVFCDILWRISLAHRFAPEMLGMDPSVVRLRRTNTEWKRMSAAAESNPNDVDDKERILDEKELTEPFTFKYVRDAFKETVDDKAYPRYKVTVPGKDKVRYFLIGKPIFQAKGLAGRGTRGYIALEYDPTSSKGRKPRVDRFVFLKDAWRMKYDGVRPEGDILADLNENQVSYVPTLLCHGDVGESVQETMTPQCWEHKHSSSSSSSSPSADAVPLASGSLKRKSTDSDVEASDREPEDDSDAHTGCPLRRHVHYRFVVEEVGKPLSAVGNERKLLSTIVDCVKAHQQAYNLGILHRDISAGNILVWPRVENLQDGRRVLRWVGLLTDWELSKRIDESPGRRQPERTGTWQFMSYGLLTTDSKVVELCDDLEAFFYVILYNAIRYVDSNCEDVATFLEDFFDCYALYQGAYYVGDKKKSAVKLAEIELNNQQKLLFAAAPMNDLVGSLLRSISAHYKIATYEHEQRRGTSDKAVIFAPQAPSQGSAADAWDDADIFLADPHLAHDQDAPSASKETTDQSLKPPTQEELTLAKDVSDHDLFLRVVRSAMHSKGWSKGSAWKGDHVSPTWKSSKKLGPPVHLAEKASRRKAQKTSSFPEALRSSSFASVPLQPSKTSGSKRGSGSAPPRC